MLEWEYGLSGGILWAGVGDGAGEGEGEGEGRQEGDGRRDGVGDDGASGSFAAAQATLGGILGSMGRRGRGPGTPSGCWAGGCDPPQLFPPPIPSVSAPNKHTQTSPTV